VHCRGKSNKQFKSKLNIVSRRCGIRYILANCDYLSVNIEMLEDLCVKKDRGHNIIRIKFRG
jgi:hypothetical protein